LSVLRKLDARVVGQAARKESRNREVTLPPVSMYRWWARRTVAVNDAILSGRSPGVLVDPFAGGGVIPLVALRLGWEVFAQDINPWACHGLESVLSLTDLEALKADVADLQPVGEALSTEVYGTTFRDGGSAQVAHTFRVAVAPCPACGVSQRLFPHALISGVRRRDRGGDPGAFLACRRGHVFRGVREGTQDCPQCALGVDPAARYTPGRVVHCEGCGHRGRISDRGPLQWEVVLVERAGQGVRELDLPTPREIDLAERRWPTSLDLGPIPEGRETRVLLRHGFRSWVDLYPHRQRYVLEALLARTSGALRLAVVGTAEMAGLCSRWDRWYLKSYESMAGHRFNFTTLTVEPNVWGLKEAGRGTVRRRTRSLVKAARWMSENVSGKARVSCGSSESLAVSSSVADLVLTDPPYHDDVEYGELSLPLRAWAGLAQQALDGEAIGGAGRDYRGIMTRIFSECRRVLKPGGHLIFSFANRDPEAWVVLFEALQEAGFWACACAAIHSENERDGTKRGVRACTLDLLLDLSPERPKEPCWVQIPGADAEADFLGRVAHGFSQVGQLHGDWAAALRGALRSSAFLA